MQRIVMGRMAFREEGDWWNAYYARVETMDGALHLGSIRLSIVRASDEMRDRFKGLMCDVLADMTEQATGVRPTHAEEQPAPEHEKAGHA